MHARRWWGVWPLLVAAAVPLVVVVVCAISLAAHRVLTLCRLRLLFDPTLFAEAGAGAGVGAAVGGRLTRRLTLRFSWSEERRPRR